METYSSLFEVCEEPCFVPWRVDALAHVPRVRGLVNQHIESFNYFVNVEMTKARANCVTHACARLFMLGADHASELDGAQ